MCKTIFKFHLEEKTYFAPFCKHKLRILHNRRALGGEQHEGPQFCGFCASFVADSASPVDFVVVVCAQFSCALQQREKLDRSCFSCCAYGAGAALVITHVLRYKECLFVFRPNNCGGRL